MARVARWLGIAKVDVRMNMIIDNENGLHPSVAHTNAVVYESTGARPWQSGDQVCCGTPATGWWAWSASVDNFDVRYLTIIDNDDAARTSVVYASVVVYSGRGTTPW